MAAATETKGPKSEADPPKAGRNRDRSDSRQLGDQEQPVRSSKSARKLSPELMRIILDALRETPVQSYAARKAGIHRKALENWKKRSVAGDDGFDLEWEGVIGRFHEHCESGSGRRIIDFLICSSPARNIGARGRRSVRQNAELIGGVGGEDPIAQPAPRQAKRFVDQRCQQRRPHSSAAAALLGPLPAGRGGG